MGIYEELQARGLIAQVTDEPEIKELLNSGNARFYIGFDPTADSLHVGHFMALCLMKRLQMAGNKPIVLLGGGTGFVGDPSGRTDMRFGSNSLKFSGKVRGISMIVQTLQIGSIFLPKHVSQRKRRKTLSTS